MYSVLGQTEAQLWMCPPLIRREKGMPEVMAMLRLPSDGKVELKVAGSLGTSQYFYGSDTVRIGNWHWWSHVWEYDCFHALLSAFCLVED